jgi:hypothetical protein
MGQNREYSKEVREVSDFKTKDILLLLELREYEPTTPLPISSSKFNRGVRQMFEDMEYLLSDLVIVTQKVKSIY